MSESRRGIVLSGLTQTVDLRPVREPRLPRDANSEALFSLFQRGRRANDLMDELARIDELYPGKYEVGIGIQAAPLRAREIRAYLILWDIVDYPIVRGFSAIDSAPDDDLTLLVDQGFVVRSRIEINATGGFDAVVERTHHAAFGIRESAEPGCWSMARDAHSLRWRATDEDHGRGVLVRLYGCIPIPDAAVPIHEILEFRARRRDELLSLRAHLEGIYQRISLAGDRSLSLNTEVSQFERSLADYVKAGQDSRMRFRIFDLTCQIKVQFDFRAGILAGGVAYASHLPLYASVLAGIGGAVFPKLEISSTSAPRSVRASSTPFEYVTSLRKLCGTPAQD